MKDDNPLPRPSLGTPIASKGVGISFICLGGVGAVFALVSALSQAIAAKASRAEFLDEYSAAMFALGLLNVAFVVVGIRIVTRLKISIAFVRGLSLGAIVLTIVCAGLKGMFFAQLNRTALSLSDDDNLMDGVIIYFSFVSIAWFLVLPCVGLLGIRGT